MRISAPNETAGTHYRAMPPPFSLVFATFTISTEATAPDWRYRMWDLYFDVGNTAGSQEAPKNYSPLLLTSKFYPFLLLMLLAYRRDYHELRTRARSFFLPKVFILRKLTDRESFPAHFVHSLNTYI